MVCVSFGFLEAFVQDLGKLLGGSSQLGSVVNKHGDRKSPKDRVVPLPNSLNDIEMAVILTTYYIDPPTMDDPVIFMAIQQCSKTLT